MSDLMKFKEIRILTNLGYPCNFCMRKNYELPISIVWKMLSTLTSDEFAIEQYSSTLLGTYSLDCPDTPSPSTLLGDYSLSRSDTPSAFTSESKINLTEELRIWLPHVNFGRLPQKQSRSPKPNQCTLSCSTQKCAAAFQGT